MNTDKVIVSLSDTATHILSPCSACTNKHAMYPRMYQSNVDPGDKPAGDRRHQETAVLCNDRQGHHFLKNIGSILNLKSDIIMC